MTKRRKKSDLETAEKLLSAALQQPTAERSRMAIEALNAITEIVLAYRPKARSKPAVQRKRRANKIARKTDE